MFYGENRKIIQYVAAEKFTQTAKSKKKIKKIKK